MKLTIAVDDLGKSTRIRTVDKVLEATIENPLVKGFEVTKTEKVSFFRRGRYAE